MTVTAIHDIERIAPYRYRVPSETTPGRSYSVQVSPSGRGVCDCIGSEGAARAGRVCKHIRSAIERMKEDQDMTSENGHEGGAAVAVRDNTDVLAVTPPSAVLPSSGELGAMITIANSIYKTSGKLIPENIKSAEEALAIMLGGWELGIPPMSAFREIYIVKGRTSPSYRVLAGLVLQGDPRARFIWTERTDKSATVELRRGNGNTSGPITYTWAMAEKAGLTGSDFYKKYPQDALAKMALTRACRLAGADLITGIGASTRHAPAVMREFDPDDLPTLDEGTAPTPAERVQAERTAQRESARANQHRTDAPTADDEAQHARAAVADAIRADLMRIANAYERPKYMELLRAVIVGEKKRPNGAPDFDAYTDDELRFVRDSIAAWRRANGEDDSDGDDDLPVE